MSTPKSISGTNRPRQSNSPFHTISFSNRDSSPRAASLARLAQSPLGTPLRSGTHTPTQRRGSGTVTPTSSTHPAAPLLEHDFRKIESYGSINAKPGTSALSRQEWHPQDEDPEIIRKHLVSGFESGGASTPQVHTSPKPRAADTVPLSEEFNSLQLQGGDITRQVYRYAEQSTRRGSSAHQRSHSFSYPARHDDGDTAHDIMVPGGFRRNFLQRAYTQPAPGDGPPTFVTRNFLHFLTLYGHFAGEDLEEWEDAITGIICS
jgi:solute carrier family 36 (proton-coupled amino acid transporter)